MAGQNSGALTAEDLAQVATVREKLGEAEATKFAAEIYKLRLAPGSSGFVSTLPRGLIVLIAIWVGLLETADKLPQLLLAFPQYQAMLADYKAKLVQPELAAAQLRKAQFDAQAAAFQPDLTSAQLDKTKLETKAAGFQPALVAAQAFKAEVDSIASGMIMSDLGSNSRLRNMFDLLDPNHPGMVSMGLSEPNVLPLVPYVTAKKKAESSDSGAGQAAQAPPPKPAPQPAPAPQPQSAPAAPPAPEPLRTPANFDCANAYMSTDYVICSSPELLDGEARLEDAYKAALAAKGEGVRAEEHDWIKRRSVDCGLPGHIRPSQPQIDGAKSCVLAATEKRIVELQAER